MAPATYQSLAQQNLATISFIQAVVRQEFANVGVQTNSHTPQPIYTPAHNADHHCAPVVAAAATSGPRFTPRYRNPSEWRTPDDRPISFSCSRVGHISRHCRNKWYSRPSFSNDRRQDRRQYSQPTFPDDHLQDPSPCRSSPRPAPSYADVVAHRNWSSRSPSPQDRQSRSPQRRRSPSPAYSGHPPGN